MAQRKDLVLLYSGFDVHLHTDSNGNDTRYKFRKDNPLEALDIRKLDSISIIKISKTNA